MLSVKHFNQHHLERCFFLIFLNTRSCAALRAADLDLIVGPGYSSGGCIWRKTMKNQPGTMKNHEKQPGTMKNRPGTMKNHENRPGTMENLLWWKWKKCSWGDPTDLHDTEWESAHFSLLTRGHNWPGEAQWANTGSWSNLVWITL